MATLDSIFASEFKQTCQQRLGVSGAINLNDIAVPKELQVAVPDKLRSMSKVKIRGIAEEYYSSLNNSVAYLWTRPNLKRREFDSEGNFIKDKNTGRYKTKDVPLPNGCAAVISDVQIKVPNKFKSKEEFDYVDYVTIGGKNYLVYIVPKQYCYKVNELCMVISFTRQRAIYGGIELKLLSGHTVYLSIIPYKASKAYSSNYRVLSVKTSRNFDNEWKLLYEFWVQNNILYPREICELSEPVGGITNVAYRELNSTLDEYQIYDETKSLADGSDEIEDIEIEGN